MKPFQSVLASSDAMIADAQRIRWLVYAEEERMLATGKRDAPATPPIRLTDSRDASTATAHLLVYAGEEPVGTVRLTELDTSRDAERSADQLDAPFDVVGLPPDARPAVVERFCILRRFRGTHVAGALYRGLIAESVRRGISHWLAVANTETDCAQDAALAYRVALSQGLGSDNVRANPLAQPCPSTPCRRHVYTPQQRQRAARDGLADIPLPRTLSLFARKMGGRYAGPPIYDPTFQVFGLPLVARLDGLGR